MKIGVLISGGGTNLQAVIDSVKSGYIDAEIAVVISNRKGAYGLVRATENHIEALFVSAKECANVEAYNHKILNKLKIRNVQLVVLAGYMKILSNEFIDAYPNRIINIHPSLIPSFCGMGFYGLKVHQAAIDYGVKVSGATVHFVDKIADHGAVILQEAVEISDTDTAETLQQKVLKIEHKLLPQAIKFFCEGKLKVIENESNRMITKILDTPN